MSQTTSGKLAAGLGNWTDERFGAAKVVKGFARKIFPDHWSFMLGEIALYSFIILLLSGTFLTFFFIPSAGETTYQGSYAPLVGQRMSEAYESTIRLSFDVRGGLLLRQIHHWAALIFVAAIMVHMLRVFVTGAFRKPREINWVIGSLLAVLAVLEGFAGYSLPDDLLSGTGLRIASSLILAIPVVGSYLSFFTFGGQFPGEAFIPRLYTIHVLLVPGIMLALIAAHLAILVLHKHSHYPGPGRTNQNVVGYPFMPVYMAKAGGFFFIVFGITALMSAIFMINPIWAYGAYDPSPVSAGTQPDWYMGFLDGALRLTPGFLEFSFAGYTLSLNILFPGLILPGILTMILIFYPWFEQLATGDRREHHLLDRPRNAPARTGIAAASITFYVLLLLGGGNDLMATHFHLSINDITNTLRVLVIVGPFVAYMVAKRMCLGLQRKDREKVLHGRETGRVFRTAEGEVFELHEPLGSQERWILVQHEALRPRELPPAVDDHGVRRPGSRLDRWRGRISRFYFQDRVEPVTPAELAAAHHDHHELEQISGEHEPEHEPEHEAVTARE